MQPTMNSDCKLVRVLTALMCEPWLLTPQMHKTLTDIAKAHAFGGDAEAAQHSKAAEMPANPAPTRYSLIDVPELDMIGQKIGTAGTVAAIPITDVIGRKFSSALYSSGVTSIDVFQRLVKTAAEDPSVTAIVLSIDSPGGVAMGTPEAAESVRLATNAKPVIAYVDGLCCSAAYWIASQANAIYSMPSAEIGSIGAYMAVTDVTRMAEMEGIRVEMFKSGQHKGMGYPGTSLTDKQREMLQAQVIAIADKFKAAVREGRDAAMWGRVKRSAQISDDVMQGQSFAVEQALESHLIDEVATFDTAVRDAVTMAKMSAGKGERR
jgi:signal peptide peptidase SppA